MALQVKLAREDKIAPIYSKFSVPTPVACDVTRRILGPERGGPRQSNEVPL